MPGCARMKIAIHYPAPTFDSYRAALVRSLFNADGIGFDLDADLPIDGPDAEPWQIGLVVGPSGSGKSSIGSRIWGEKPCVGPKAGPRTGPSSTPFPQRMEAATGRPSPVPCPPWVWETCPPGCARTMC